MRNATEATKVVAVTEAKRGRGRPPKAGAMTNAERQAAFRARRRAAPVTVTGNAAPAVVEDNAGEELRKVRRKLEVVQHERDKALVENEKLRATLAVVREQVDHSVRLRYDLDVALEANVTLEREIQRLCLELKAANKALNTRRG